MSNIQLAHVSGELTPGGTYYLIVQTKSPMSEEQSLTVTNELKRKFGIIPEGTSIVGNKMSLKFKTQPFHSYQIGAVAIIAFLPEILAVIGLAMIGVGLFVGLSTIPTWALVVAAIGIGLVFIGPVAGRFIQGRASKGRETEVAEAERSGRETLGPYYNAAKQAGQAGLSATKSVYQRLQ